MDRMPAPLRLALLLMLGTIGGSARGADPEITPLPHPGGPTPKSFVGAAGCVDSAAILQGPVLHSGQTASGLAAARTQEIDHPLAINLATALRLADARPLVIAAAQASLRQAAAQLDQARVMWLPNVYLGASYLRHDGGGAGNSGDEFINGRDQFLAGGGLVTAVSSNDAIFAPLALKQVVRSRQIDIQTARNDALLDLAVAYFNVQEARGRVAGAQDTVEKARELARKVTVLGKDLVPPFEANRARGALADAEVAAAAAREAWQVASTDLTRALRLNPTAVVEPLEPPYLQVTLISPTEPVDNLIPIGLTNRPELASQQALVQATLIRIRQEKLRPLMPSLILQGDPSPVAPGGYLMGGVFGSDVSGRGNAWTGRNDVNVQVLWELRNLGFGNRALVRERQAEQERAIVELFRIQDQVAAEVARAHAQLESAVTRVGRAEAALREARATYSGTMRGLSETSRFGDVLVLVSRPQEAVAALQQLLRAYDEYFLGINDYNRAQFRLFRALGYPAAVLACERSPDEVKPVDTERPPPLPPVNGPEPCRCPH